MKVSKLYVLVVGLNQNKSWYSFLYFLHYFFIRIVTSVLVLVTAYERSIVVVSILLGTQFFALLMNIVKLYESKISHLLTILREI